MTERNLDGVTGDARKRLEQSTNVPVMLVPAAYYLTTAGNRLDLLQERRDDLLLEHRRIMADFHNVSNAIEDLKAEINETERSTLP